VPFLNRIVDTEIDEVRKILDELIHRAGRRKPRN
jgi:hypothetical protein